MYKHAPHSVWGSKSLLFGERLSYIPLLIALVKPKIHSTLARTAVRRHLVDPQGGLLLLSLGQLSALSAPMGRGIPEARSTLRQHWRTVSSGPLCASGVLKLGALHATAVARISFECTGSSRDPGGPPQPALVATGARLTVKPSCPRLWESRSRTGHCTSLSNLATWDKKWAGSKV